jgi:hypothetical protein
MAKEKIARSSTVGAPGLLLLAVFLMWMFLSSSASAQGVGSAGLPLHVYGVVQVEPGPRVLTLAVKDEYIRFALHNAHSVNSTASLLRMLTEHKHRMPSIYLKGADIVLDRLIAEKPGERTLKLIGMYHPDGRTFVVDTIKPFREQPQ